MLDSSTFFPIALFRSFWLFFALFRFFRFFRFFRQYFSTVSQADSILLRRVSMVSLLSRGPTSELKQCYTAYVRSEADTSAFSLRLSPSSLSSRKQPNWDRRVWRLNLTRARNHANPIKASTSHITRPCQPYRLTAAHSRWRAACHPLSSFIFPLFSLLSSFRFPLSDFRPRFPTPIDLDSQYHDS